MLFVFCFYAMVPCVLRVAAQRKVHCSVVCVCFYAMVPCVLRVAAQRKVHFTVVCVLFLRRGALCFEGSTL